jgi:hypothetical protein
MCDPLSTAVKYRVDYAVGKERCNPNRKKTPQRKGRKEGAKAADRTKRNNPLIQKFAGALRYTSGFASLAKTS